MKNCSDKIFSFLFIIISVLGYGQNNNVYDPSAKIPKPSLFRQHIPLNVGVTIPKSRNILYSHSVFINSPKSPSGTTVRDKNLNHYTQH